MEKLIPSPVTFYEEQATGQAPAYNGNNRINEPNGKEVECYIKMGLSVAMAATIGVIVGVCLTKMYYSNKYNEIEVKCSRLENDIKRYKERANE